MSKKVKEGIKGILELHKTDICFSDTNICGANTFSSLLAILNDSHKKPQMPGIYKHLKSIED